MRAPQPCQAAPGASTRAPHGALSAPPSARATRSEATRRASIGEARRRRHALVREDPSSASAVAVVEPPTSPDPIAVSSRATARSRTARHAGSSSPREASDAHGLRERPRRACRPVRVALLARRRVGVGAAVGVNEVLEFAVATLHRDDKGEEAAGLGERRAIAGSFPGAEMHDGGARRVVDASDPLGTVALRRGDRAIIGRLGVERDGAHTAAVHGHVEPESAQVLAVRGERRRRVGSATRGPGAVTAGRAARAGERDRQDEEEGRESRALRHASLRLASY